MHTDLSAVHIHTVFHVTLLHVIYTSKCSFAGVLVRHKYVDLSVFHAGIIYVPTLR